MKRLAFVAALALAGCSSTKTFHSAFDDITHDTRATVGEFSTYRQLITLNGLMPMHVPGMLFYEPTTNLFSGWLQKESPGLLVGISPKRSMVVEARYDADKPEQAVAAAQTSYQRLRTKAVAAVAARLRVALFDALAQASDEQRIRMLARYLNLPQDKPDPAEIASQRKAAFDFLENARKELEKAQADFSDNLRHNVMVARWTKKEEFQGLARVADLIGLGSGRQSEESGVLVLAGIRVLNAFLGEDLFCLARQASQHPGQWEHLKKISISINMIQARAVGYVSDLDFSQSLALSLDISKDQLNQLFKDGLLDAAGTGARVKAEALVATAMGVSNFGRMVRPVVEQRKTRFYPASRQVEELEEELDGKDKYVTVSVTRVQFTEQMLEGLANAATDTICNEELEPGRSLTETVARTRRRIEMSASGAANLLGHGKDALPNAAAIRHTLNEKVASARAQVDACRPWVAEMDQDVADALAAEMTAVEHERTERRYRVRIRQLERDQDSASLLSYLNGMSEQLYEARKELRAADALRREKQDPAREVARVIALLGVRDPKVIASGGVSVPPSEKEDGVRDARSAPGIQPRDSLAAGSGSVPHPKVAMLCNGKRPSRH